MSLKLNEILFKCIEINNNVLNERTQKEDSTGLTSFPFSIQQKDGRFANDPRFRFFAMNTYIEARYISFNVFIKTNFKKTIQESNVIVRRKVGNKI